MIKNSGAICAICDAGGRGHEGLSSHVDPKVNRALQTLVALSRTNVATRAGADYFFERVTRNPVRHKTEPPKRFSARKLRRLWRGCDKSLAERPTSAGPGSNWSAVCQTFVVGIDLNPTGQNYPELWNRLKQSSKGGTTWIRTAWLVVEKNTNTRSFAIDFVRLNRQHRRADCSRHHVTLPRVGRVSRNKLRFGLKRTCN